MGLLIFIVRLLNLTKNIAILCIRETMDSISDT